MKKKVSLTVSIPHPCTQSWNEMNPVENGRYCLHCQKTVIDFSVMTDKEILAVISQQQGNLCGNFQPAQLNRALVDNTKPRHAFLPAAMLASFIATIIPGNSQAHKPGPGPAMEQAAADHVLKEDDPRLFKGQIIDSLSNEGLHGVSISMKGISNVGAITDAAGNFQVKIPSGFTALKFRISCTGYNTKEVSFTPGQLSSPITISLQQSVTDLQELVITGYPTKRAINQVGALSVMREEAIVRRLTLWERIVRLFKKKEKCTQ